MSSEVEISKAPSGAGLSHLFREIRLYSTLAVTALLLGRATVYGVLFPFVPALAVALAEVSPAASAVVAVVGLLSLYHTLGLGQSAAAASGLLVWALALLPVRSARVRRGASPLLLVAACFAAGAAAAAFTGEGPDAYWLAAFQGVFAGALAATFSPAVRRLCGDPDSTRTTLSAVALLAAAVAGLDGLALGAVTPVTVLGAALLALTSLEAGGGAAAAAGAVFAAVASLGRGIVISEVGALALAGALAGLLRGLGRLGVVFGVSLGLLAATYSTAPVSTLGGTLLSALLGATIAVLVPRSWWGGLLEVLGAGPGPEGPGRVADEGAAAWGTAAWGRVSAERGQSGATPTLREEATQRVKAIARLFEELSQAFAQPAPSTQVVDGPADKVASPQPGWGEAGPAQSRGSGPQPAPPPGSGELAQLVEAVAARVCQGCDLQGTCWNSEIYRTYRNLSEAWSLAEAQGGITPGRFSGDFRRQCIHLADMATGLNQVQDLVRLSRYWEHRTEEGRALVATQLAGVAQIMHGLADGVELNREADQTPRGLSDRRPALGYEIGISRASKGGAAVSGDALLHRPLNNDRLLLALSDGMGAGPRAAQESQVTVDLVNRLLEAGFPPEVAVRTVNSVLLLRSPDEVFATLDLLLLNLDTGRAALLKTGAAPTFVRRGSKVSVVKSASLPAGILTQIEVPLSHYQLQAGDLVVMVTDGLLSDLSEAQLAEFLQRFPRQEPQLVAEALLALALPGPSTRPADDITVCALLLSEAGQRRRPSSGWVPARWRPIAPERGGR